MRKTYTVIIVDNETQEEYLRIDNAIGIIGAIGHEVGIKSVCRMRCNSFQIAGIIGALQDHIARILQDHPEIDDAVKMLCDLLNENGDHTDEDL